MRDDFDDWARELVSVKDENERRARRSRRKAMSIWLKVFVVAAVLITVASSVLAVMALFTQTPSYTSAANLTSGCTSPAGPASGTLIRFTCGSLAAIYVSSTSTGSVTYSAFTQPTNVTDAFLIDVASTPNTSCSTWSSGGDEPVPLLFAGGSITIGSTSGRLKPGHAYDYCMDFSPAPPSFTFTVAWTQP